MEGSAESIAAFVDGIIKLAGTFGPWVIVIAVVFIVCKWPPWRKGGTT